MLQKEIDHPVTDCLIRCFLFVAQTVLMTVALLGVLALIPGTPMQGTAIYMLTGVFQTESTDLVAEANVFASRLRLRPGMTICEMGSANGALMTELGHAIMPGGNFVATSPVAAELAATRHAVAKAGLGTVSTYKATSEAWAPGLAPGTCDVLYSRMVIHMIPKEVVATYVPQWAVALKPGGRMFMTDHNSMDGVVTGPRRPMMKLFGVFTIMPIVPQWTEVDEITTGGFTLLEGPYRHPFYSGGYGTVYTPAP